MWCAEVALDILPEYPVPRHTNPDWRGRIAGPVSVRLWTSSSTGLTCAQLVISIMNPSHRVSGLYLKKAASTGGPESTANCNEIVTVEQHSDLVAFLAPHYTWASRPGYKYPVYKYGNDDPKRQD